MVDCVKDRDVVRLENVGEFRAHHLENSYTEVVQELQLEIEELEPVAGLGKRFVSVRDTLQQQ